MAEHLRAFETRLGGFEELVKTRATLDTRAMNAVEALDTRVTALETDITAITSGGALNQDN